ncbi:MAG: nicotinamide-nucleotide amidohydrolase family protein [Candidatus Phosphoribacter sp.]|nr:nicotinamide-nucleotide amidohydrolase family protein [Actinomycetales bacterium]
MRAAQVLAELAMRGETIGCAESITGGLLTSRLVEVPGASRVVRGAVVAYATDLKTRLLDVSADLLLRSGAVDPRVAAAMAQGVCRALECDWGVATTGVAGPDPVEGKAVGTAYVAVVRSGGAAVVRELHLGGERDAVRVGVVEAALDLLYESLTADQAP